MLIQRGTRLQMQKNLTGRWKKMLFKLNKRSYGY